MSLYFIKSKAIAASFLNNISCISSCSLGSSSFFIIILFNLFLVKRYSRLIVENLGINHLSYLLTSFIGLCFLSSLILFSFYFILFFGLDLSEIFSYISVTFRAFRLYIALILIDIKERIYASENNCFNWTKDKRFVLLFIISAGISFSLPLALNIRFTPLGGLNRYFSATPLSAAFAPPSSYWLFRNTSSSSTDFSIATFIIICLVLSSLIIIANYILARYEKLRAVPNINSYPSTRRWSACAITNTC